ncbi:Uncharacterized protein Fot_11750 [Forsythia ovata]|uniref:Uncharacterized protein n=1 Tax=Forsythia ovata TaxID=205694 RepID=A0ABD1WPC2_9LAMI
MRIVWTENNPGMRFLGCSYYRRTNTCDYFKLVNPLVHPHYNSVINSLLQNANREVVGNAMGMVVTTSNGWILLSTHIIRASSMVCCRMLTKKLLATSSMVCCRMLARSCWQWFCWWFWFSTYSHGVGIEVLWV